MLLEQAMEASGRAWAFLAGLVRNLARLHLWNLRRTFVCQKPVPKFVCVAGSLHSHVNGRYKLLSTQANGQPLWKHISESSWLYSMTDKYWGIGGNDEFDNEFQTNSAWVATTEEHHNRWPTDMPGLWKQWHGTNWSRSDAILVFEVSVELFVLCHHDPGMCEFQFAINVLMFLLVPVLSWGCCCICCRCCCCFCCWLYGWPVGWLAGSLACLLVDWLLGWRAGCLVGRLCRCWAGWLGGWQAIWRAMCVAPSPPQQQCLIHMCVQPMSLA